MLSKKRKTGGSLHLLNFGPARWGFSGPSLEPDDGDGGGTVDLPAAVEPEQQAQGVSLDQMKDMFAEFKNGIFADLRRSGAMNKKKEQKQEHKIEPSDDIQSLMARERSFERATSGKNLSENALKRLERAFHADSPDDVSVWVSEYLSDFGLSDSENGKSSSPGDNINASDNPVTNLPAPAGTTPVETRDPYEYTTDDVEALVHKHGAHKAGKLLLEMLRKAPKRSLAKRSR